MLYKIEIFERDYTFRSFAPIEQPEIEFDYLTIQKTQVTCKSITASKGDFAHITDSTGAVVYQGIVDDTDTKKNAVTLQLQPLLSLFDTDIYFDRTQSAHVENFLKSAIIANFSESGDTEQNINGLTVETTSDTRGALNLKDNIHNLYEIMVSALTKHGIVVNAELRPQRKQLAVTIGKQTATATIEADLPAIVEKSIIIGDSYGQLNKLTLVNEDNEAEQATYYLQQSGSVSTSNTNRITPVFFGFDFVSVGTDETFSDAAYAKAYDKLAAQKYDNLIEVTAETGSGILPPSLALGTEITVRSGGDVYQTILTGYSRTERLTTLTMGCVRADLTKRLILERRNT